MSDLSDDNYALILSSSSEEDEDEAMLARTIKAICDMLSDDSDEEMITKIIPVAGQVMLAMHDRVLNPIHLKRGGLKMGREFIDRDHMLAFAKLEHNYFAPNCRYNDEQFKTRFRIEKPVFLFLYEKLCSHPHFQLKYNAANKASIHPKVKFTAALRFLAYGSAADALDEIFYLSKDDAFLALKDLCYALNYIFGEEYLRIHNVADMRRLLEEAEDRGWPGCIGSLDCTTWLWKNCPVALVGRFIGKKSYPAVVLEALCSHDGWIWHSFFGSSGGFNDITILEHSPIFDPYCIGTVPPIEFEVCSNTYHLPYFLCDGIYPRWATLINAKKYGIADATPVQKYFTMCHESTRKDIESVFGNLKNKWHILERNSHFYTLADMTIVANACVILHNILIHKAPGGEERDYIPDETPPIIKYPKDSEAFGDRLLDIRDGTVNTLLKRDLTAHLHISSYQYEVFYWKKFKLIIKIAERHKTLVEYK